MGSRQPGELENSFMDLFRLIVYKWKTFRGERVSWHTGEGQKVKWCKTVRDGENLLLCPILRSTLILPLTNYGQAEPI